MPANRVASVKQDTPREKEGRIAQWGAKEGNHFKLGGTGYQMLQINNT